MASDAMLIVSFSGRDNGNCRALADFIASRGRRGKVSYLCAKDLNIRECGGCNYQCMSGPCVHNDDEVAFWEKTRMAKRVIWLVPMYCGNPSSLFFKINERGQRFWMDNEDYYHAFLHKLTIIGIGNLATGPQFVEVFRQLYANTPLWAAVEEHILILEAMKLGLNSSQHTLIHEEGVQAIVEDFLGM